MAANFATNDNELEINETKQTKQTPQKKTSIKIHVNVFFHILTVITLFKYCLHMEFSGYDDKTN